MDIEAYPAIKRHLEQFREKLEPKPKDWSGKTWPGRKAGNYEWFHIQDQIAYWEEFEKPKIIIPAIEKAANYCVDTQGFYSNDKTSICVSEENWFLAAVLNSSILFWVIQRVAATRQGGYYEFKPMYVTDLPIPPATEAQKAELSDLAQASAAPTAAGDTQRLQTLEARIDEIVCGLFGVDIQESGLIQK